jgi:uncharacterized protein
MTGHPAPWPILDLDVASLRKAGHQPASFRQFLLKIHSRCNLSCDYCYVYEMADQAWRGLPKLMSGEIAAATVDRITEHVEDHRIPQVEIILHGGEPLLAGAPWIANLVTALRRRVPAQVDVSLQTNGTLLDRFMLAAATASMPSPMAFPCSARPNSALSTAVSCAPSTCTTIQWLPMSPC